jgi:uncharacterized protein
MKISTLIVILFCFLSPNIKAQTQENTSENGMKKYMFVMYTKGPNRTHDSATAAHIQVAHLNHMDSLYKIGLLNVAGPMLDNGDWRGILISDVATKEEAEALVLADPAVIAGRLSYTVVPWMTQKGNCFK